MRPAKTRRSTSTMEREQVQVQAVTDILLDAPRPGDAVEYKSRGGVIRHGIFRNAVGSRCAIIPFSVGFPERMDPEQARGIATLWDEYCTETVKSSRVKKLKDNQP